MYNTESDSTMVEWMTSKRFTPDATTNSAIRRRVLENLEQLGGYPSIASWERAYLELLNEDAIQPFRGSIGEQPTSAPAISPEAITFPRVSAFEERRRCATDPQFKKFYNLYLNAQLKAKVAAEENEATLTVEAYNN